MLMSDDFTGADGSALDAAKWDTGAIRTRASVVQQVGTALFNAGTIASYGGGASMLVDLATRADADVVFDFEFDQSEAFIKLHQRAPADGSGTTTYELFLSLVDQTWALQRG